jgi:hypothetical protein
MRCMRCGSAVDDEAQRCPACGEDLILVLLSGEQEPAEVAPSPTPKRGSKTVAMVAAVAAVWGLLVLVGGQPGSEPLAAGTLSPRRTDPDVGATAVPIQPGVLPRDAGGLYLCPQDAPYAAYRRMASHFYPPNHPVHPGLAVQPDWCYRTPAEAEAAGYTLGLPGPQAREVDMVYLVEVDLRLYEDCWRAARELGFSVPCPGILPNPATGERPFRCPSENSGPQLSCTYRGVDSTGVPTGRTYFVIQLANFAVPPSWFASAPALLIAAWRSDASLPILGTGTFECTRAGRIRRMFVRGNDAWSFPCRFADSYSVSGASILQWREGGVINQVAVFGPDATARELAWWVATFTTHAG